MDLPLFNSSETKELIVDMRKKEAKTEIPVDINGAEVERVNNFRFVGINITDNLSCSLHIYQHNKDSTKTTVPANKTETFPCTDIGTIGNILSSMTRLGAGRL